MFGFRKSAECFVSGKIEKLLQEIEALKIEVQELEEEKQQRDAQVEKFTTEIDNKIEEWKVCFVYLYCTGLDL